MMNVATIAIWLLLKLFIVLYTEGKTIQREDIREGDILNIEQEVTPLERTFKIQMPGAKPQKEDYLCTPFSVKNMTQGTSEGKVYATSFEADTNTSMVGHVGLNRCRNQHMEEGEVWSCWDPRDICNNSARGFMYAWSSPNSYTDAGPLSLPADMGFKIDEAEEGYIVMQVRHVQWSSFLGNFW